MGIVLQIKRHEDDIDKRGERLVRATRNKKKSTSISRTTNQKTKVGRNRIGRFKRLPSDISLEKTWMWLTK